MNHIIAIDPGLCGTGYAVIPFDGRAISPPVQVGTCNYKDEYGFANNARSYADWLNDLIPACSGKHGKVVKVICEWPNFRTDEIGYASTSKGDIYKLCYLIGAFGEVVRSNEIIFDLIDVPSWKGQLSKAIIIERIEILIGHDTCNRLKIKTHAWDAVGIGLYAKGYRFTGLHS